MGLFEWLGVPQVRALADDAERLPAEWESALLGVAEFQEAELERRYPLRLEHPAKQRLFARTTAVPAGDGVVRAERFRARDLPSRLLGWQPRTTVRAEAGWFDYSDRRPGAWYLNFAHQHLFHSYGHAPFAQDEIQVAEHPALGSLRHALEASGDALAPLTRTADGPTPVLIRGASRRAAIDTTALYGRRLAMAEPDVIDGAVQAFDEAVPTRILAMEAPVNSGSIRYRREEIQHALRTAWLGFRAVVLSAARLEQAEEVVIHTGDWGCGAYGGERELMLTIQIVAARLAGIHELVLHHGGDDRGETDRIIGNVERYGVRPGRSTASIVARLDRAGFTWGRPDRN